ncbi:MAG TPA: S8 family serine peptidase [Myxococcus sp.]|nr:S8 family serine peptidase [Myxococcus sp.]
MKRWVYLGLVAGLVACTEKKPPPDDVEPQACPGTSETWVPSVPLSQQGVPEEDASGVEDVIVTFRASGGVSAMAMSARADALAAQVTRVGAQAKRRIPSLNMVSAQVTAAQREALERNPDVLRVEPDRRVYALGMPRLPARALLGGIVPPNRVGSVGEYTDGLKMVKAPDVWDANNDGALDTGAPTGTGIKVCVIDSGWDSRHPELRAAYVGGKDFVDDDDLPEDASVDARGNTLRGGGHGSHTAGTIAAQLGAGGKVRPGEDTNGVAGVAPTVDLLVARVLDVRGSGSTADVIAAMEWCASQGANIASLSLGSDKEAPAERTAFEAAAARGILSIAASGNAGTGKVAFPAAYPTVLAVGAVNFASEWAEFSQYGPELALVAPGVNVLSAALVEGAPFADVGASGTHFTAQPLEYSAVGQYTSKLVYCGLGDSITSCGEAATCDGFVALVDRGGGILFEEKARNAIRAGAKAVIIGNNEPDDGTGNFTLTSPNANWKPTASVSLADAALLKQRVGQEVAVDVSGVDYTRQSGTSMATPHVAGVAALVWSSCPGLSASQVKQALIEGAKDLGPDRRDDKFGHGLVQATDALQAARALCPPPQP